MYEGIRGGAKDEQTAALRLAVKQYIPFSNLNPQQGQYYNHHIPRGRPS